MKPKKKIKINNICGFGIFVFLVFSVSLFFAKNANSSSATLYLSPSSGSFLVGSTFSVSVFLNTDGDAINTVWADIEFPPGILQITSPTAGASFIKNWLTPPNYSNEKGIVSFRGGIPGGIKTSAGLISSITFRTISSGTAKIKFGKESRILLNDGKGTDILQISVNGEYQIVVPAPEGPKVFSPTHPDSGVWYSDSSPSFSWEKEDNIRGYSWSFSQNPQGRPDGVSEGIVNSTSYNNVQDGIWYFHIRQEKNGIWGQTSHVAVRIDTNPPKDFTPKVVTYSRLVGYQTLVYFESSDDFSGIDHYEVSTVDLSEAEGSRSFFTEEISPYKIPFVKAGKYDVIIRAIDRAGNIKESEAGFRLLTPLISHIRGTGLEIRGILLPWWLLIVSLIIILGMIIGIILVIIGHKRRQHDQQTI